VDGVVWTNKKLRANLREFVRGGKHEFADTLPVAAMDAPHILRERMGMHRNFRMIVRSHELRTLYADGSITKGRTLSRTSDDTDVLRLDLRFQSGISKQKAKSRDRTTH
jgi:hypothetical protein